MSDFYFKASKVKGDVYMQVWHKERGYLGSLGSAKAAYKLVKSKNGSEQTNKKEDFPTNKGRGEESAAGLKTEFSSEDQAFRREQDE